MKPEEQNRLSPASSVSGCARVSILSLMDKGILFLIFCLILTPPLFLIPRVATYDTVTHVKFLFVNFTFSTLAILCAARLFFFQTCPSMRKDPARMLIAAFAVVILISCLLSREVKYCLHLAAFVWTYHLMFLVMPEIFRPGVRREGVAAFLGKMRLIMVFTGLLVGVYGLCQYFGGDFIFRWLRYDIKDKIARNYIISTIGNPEYLGSYLAPLILLCLPEFIENERKAFRVLALFAIVIFISAILLSGTRGALFALGFGFIPIFFYTYGESLKPRKFHVLAALGALLIFILIFIVIFSCPNPLNRHNQDIWRRFKNLGDLQSASIKERIFFYSIGSEMIARNPVFGVGEGMFRVNFYPAAARLSEKDDKAGVARYMIELKNRVADHAHNDFLQIWIENGTVGFMVFTLAMTFVMAQAFSVVFAKTRPSRDRRLMVCFTSASFCVLINAAFSFPMHTPSRSALFWCLLGATHSGALILTAKEQNKNRETPQ